MRSLLCPICKELIAEESPDFPRCTYCGELVVRCGACRHFPGDGQVCHQAKGQPLVKKESVLDCPYFTPRWLISRRHPFLSPRARWQTLGSIALSFSILLIALLPQPRQPVRLVSAQVPESVVRGGVFPLQILVEAEEGRDVGVRLDRRLFAHFQTIGVDPIPTRVHPSGQALDFWFRSSSSLVRITFQLKTLQEGNYRLQASLLTADGVVADWKGAVRVVGSPQKPRVPRRLGLLALLSGR
ncbi:MAG: hypothetical protein NZ959_02970 [Armatimonadetes bacterium]|nr:hypothetical protein [Armatimonadota bacterium]MDW8121587.1 hypothetical protein [Armatimonadota bacterium]